MRSQTKAGTRGGDDAPNRRGKADGPRPRLRDGGDDTDHHERPWRRIAAGHPLAVLLNSAGANAVEGVAVVGKPAEGLDDRSIKGWVRQRWPPVTAPGEMASRLMRP